VCARRRSTACHALHSPDDVGGSLRFINAMGHARQVLVRIVAHSRMQARLSVRELATQGVTMSRLSCAPDRSFAARLRPDGRELTASTRVRFIGRTPASLRLATRLVRTDAFHAPHAARAGQPDHKMQGNRKHTQTKIYSPSTTEPKTNPCRRRSPSSYRPKTLFSTNRHGTNTTAATAMPVSNPMSPPACASGPEIALAKIPRYHCV